jgi:enoyl-CoA hydratase/carnithine racemase
MKAALYLEVDNQLATVIIDRVEKRNALSLQMWKRIPELFAEIESERSVKVVIVRGVDNTAFAAGVDIEEFSRIAASEELGRELMETVQAAEQSIGNCSKPVIAMIDGPCVGGGVELALACDLRFASKGSTFSVPPAKLGLVYSLSSTRRLIELIGIGRSRDLLYSARTFGAEEAERIGLIERVFDASRIRAETLSYAELLCRRSQYSIRASKAIIQAISRGEQDANPEIQRLRGGAFLEDDLREGLNAFFEKRPPEFKWGV